MELAPPPPGEGAWWAAVEAGDHDKVRSMLQDGLGSSLICSLRRVRSMGTATARRVAAKGVPALMVACDLGEDGVLRVLLEAGADACAAGEHAHNGSVELSVPDDSDYEPGEDDYSSWLAPLSPLDRAMERGNASVVTTLLKGFTGPWEALSTRMAKAKRRSTDASGSAAAAAAMYVGMFAGSMAAATAVISELQTAPTAGELAAPLSIALSRGAAGVAQALINAGADVEAAAPRKAWDGAEICSLPLCVAARALNNPASPAVLLRAGASLHHHGNADGGNGIDHLASEEAGMALYRFEQHLGAGLLNIPDRAVQLAQDTVQVLYLAQAGRPLAWCPSAHRHFPVRFRDDVRRLLAAMYAGRGQSQNPKPPGEGGDLGEAFALFKALPEATLRQRVVFEVVASMARTTVWKALPPEFWTSCGHQDRGGHIETGELL